MSLQVRIHHPVDHVDFAGIQPDQNRGEFGDAGSCPGGVGGQVDRAQGGDLTVSDESLVGADGDDGAVEDLDRLPTGPRVVPLLQGEVDLVDGDTGDLHDVASSGLNPVG